jgi:2-octaprenylphenol hydroxylase
MIEPRIIQAALLRRVASTTPVSLFCPAQLRDINITDMEARIDLDQGAALTAELVVAADGNRSRVRERLGIKTRDHDYRQSGLVALVKTEHPHKATAWQRFLPGGPLAFLPMKDGWSSIVWTLPSAEAETVLGLDKDAFHEALGQAFDFRLGRIIDSEQRAAYPLRRMHAEHYARKRVALIGDAAHAIHPLAGQGVNLGLLDAAALAEVILAARTQGKHPGNLSVLRRYERWRRGDNQIMMSAMDGFNRLFSNRQTPLRQIRNLGLTLMDVAGPAKNLLVRHAMGLAGDMPALATKNTHSPCID